MAAKSTSRRTRLTAVVAILALLMIGYAFAVRAQIPNVYPPGSGGGGSAGTVFIQNTPGVEVFPGSTIPVAGNINVAPATATLGVQVYNTAAVQVYPGATIPVSGAFTAPTSTVGALIFNTPGVIVLGTVPIATPTYAAQVFPGATIPVSLPTVGAQIFNTVPVTVPTTWIQGTVQANISGASVTQPVSVPTTWIQGTVQVGPVQATVYVAGAGATQPVSLPTIGAQIFNTVPVSVPTTWIEGTVQANISATIPVSVPTTWVQGSVSINNTPMVQLSTADPCMNSGIAKSQIVISEPTATTTALVAPIAGKTVYVCGFAFSEPQGVGTVGAQFISASGTPCANPTPISGTFALGISHPANYTSMKTGSGNGLCLTTTGAGVDPEGILSYILQ